MNKLYKFEVCNKIFLITSFLLIGVNLLLCIDAKTQNFEFIENKGQWDSKAEFGMFINNGNFFLEHSGYKVVLNNAEDISALNKHFSGHFAKSFQAGEIISNKNVALHSHAYEVKFKGASLAQEIIPEGALTTYNNYLLGSDPSKWVFHCNIYTAVTFKNVYPNIDVRYFTKNNQFTLEKLSCLQELQKHRLMFTTYPQVGILYVLLIIIKLKRSIF